MKKLENAKSGDDALEKAFVCTNCLQRYKRVPDNRPHLCDTCMPSADLIKANEHVNEIVCLRCGGVFFRVPTDIPNMCSACLERIGYHGI